jgi:hypothetical protein
MKGTVLLTTCFLVATAGVAESVPPAPRETLSGFRTVDELESSETRFPASAVVNALALAFPRRVDRTDFRDGDWALHVSGTWFYWAGGRLLPESARAASERYDPYPFYHYERGVPEIPEYTDAEIRRLERLVEQRDRNPPRRHPGFFNALWRIHDEATAYRRQKTTFFLGMKTLVHRDLLEDLAAVEEEILAAARNDRELAAFVEQLQTIEGYNYRRVDGTASLSNHSYGIAIDLIPAWYGRRQVYWRWALNAGLDWYAVPMEQRFTFPAAFVEAFERHGFVWGGKWRFFDTIHFEYRPEILMLNGFEVDLR